VLNAAYNKATTTALKEAIRNVIEHLSYPSEERIASQTKRSRDQLELPVFTTGPLGWAP
jgi:hypothetical protein